MHGLTSRIKNGDGHSLCESRESYYRGFDALAEGQEGADAVLHLDKDGQAALA